MITPPIISFVLFVAFSEWILSLFASCLLFVLSYHHWSDEWEYRYFEGEKLDFFSLDFESKTKRWIYIMRKNSMIFSIWMQYVFISLCLSLIHNRIFFSFAQVKHQARFSANTINTSSSLPPRLPLPSVELWLILCFFLYNRFFSI